MNAIDALNNDATTPGQKLTAALSGFGFACLTFFFAALVLVPITGKLATALTIPDVVTVPLVLFELFGLTSIAGVSGVAVFARGLTSGTVASSQD